MRRTLLFVISVSFFGCASVKKEPAPTKPSASQPSAISYPPARKVDVTDDYHGTKVADPYRWLEDVDSRETAEWVKAQNELSAAFLEKIPAREKIKARLTKLWNYPRFSVPWLEGERVFFSKNDGLQPQSVLWWAPRLDAEPKVLLDPNGLSKDGTVALGSTVTSDDGKLLAYSVAEAGSDWQTIKVRDVDSGQDLGDEIHWVKFSGPTWTKDGKGFFYSRYDEPKPGQELKDSNYFQKLYYHRIRTKQSEDELVYKKDSEKEWGFGPTVSDDGKYLVISVWKGTDPKNSIFVKPLDDKDARVLPMLEGFASGWDFLGNEGTSFFFKTDNDAPRGRIVRFRWATSMGHEGPREIVPQAAETIESVSLVNSQLIVSYLKDAHALVKVFDLEGKLIREQELPGQGTASGFGGKQTDTQTFFDYTDYTTPRAIYRLDLTTGKATVWKKSEIDIDPSLFEAKQVFFESKDGTRVPMTIVSKKGLVLDGQNPTLLYGYGGFNSSETPYFSIVTSVWLELGGVYVDVNLRGGGEYGEEWHKAGTKERKQNVFDDFVAAAEWLIRQKYTSTPRLAIHGASNGGLLIGACLTQRPDLFGAAIPEVGVLDMLRFHKFTIGWAWTDDYGSSDEAEGFKYLKAYSPYHNVKPGTSYPPTLILTGDHDDRVFPAHSFKFGAALQAAQGGKAPVLLRVETRAGHGAGKPTDKQIDEYADKYAFLVRVLGMEDAGRN